MTVIEAIEKMQAAVSSSRERLEGNGFTLSVETDYMNRMFKSVEDVQKAKYITVSLVVSDESTAEGEEYCMSLGAEIRGGKIDGERLDEDIQNYLKMVDDAAALLAGYENKTEGLAELTRRAGEEYEKLVARIEEDNKKSRRLSMISNIIFIVGIVLLFIVAFLM